MHLNAFTIEILATELGEILNGSHLSESYSTSPTDLVLEFSSAAMQVQFVRGEIFFFVKEHQDVARNKVPQFKTLHGLQLHKVEPHRYDRSFHLEFEGDLQLQFLCFGRNSRVYFKHGDELAQFPFSKKIAAFDHAPVDFKDEDLTSLTEQSFSKKCRFATAEQAKALVQLGFFQTVDRVQSFDHWVNDQLRREYSIDRSQEVPSLTLAKGHRKGQLFPVYDQFAREYIRAIRVKSLKDRIIHRIHDDLNVRKKKLASMQDHAQDLSADLSYRQRADLIMANVHLNVKNQKYLEVYDFFHDRDVKIPIKSDISLQANAERYYRKSKNQHLELEKRAEKIKALESDIERLEDELSEVEACDDIKSLRMFERKENEQSKKQDSKKTVFQTLQFKGFDIWIGKNAKQNDAVLHASSKNDVWLHLRDQAGSHVVIRNQNNEKIPEDVLTFAASLAAWHSKGKNEHTAAVIHTPRKFVRKFKGALPGQVKVDREDVILVDPLFWKEQQI